MLHISKKISRRRYKIKPVVKIYDYSKGISVGRLTIPKKERCMSWLQNFKNEPVFDFITSNLSMFVIGCQIHQYSYSVTTYTFFKTFKGNDSLIDLQRRAHKIVTWNRRAGFSVLQAGEIRKGFVIFSVTRNRHLNKDVLELVILRNIRHNLDIQQQVVLISMTGFSSLTTDSIFDKQHSVILFRQYRRKSRQTLLYMTEIACLRRNNLSMNIGAVIRKTSISIGSHEGKSFKFFLKHHQNIVFLDQNMNILRLHGNQGYSTLDTIHLYEKIV
jgi:hypothetical protein